MCTRPFDLIIGFSFIYSFFVHDHSTKKQDPDQFFFFICARPFDKVRGHSYSFIYFFLRCANTSSTAFIVVLPISFAHYILWRAACLLVYAEHRGQLQLSQLATMSLAMLQEVIQLGRSYTYNRINSLDRIEMSCRYVVGGPVRLYLYSRINSLAKIEIWLASYQLNQFAQVKLSQLASKIKLVSQLARQSSTTPQQSFTSQHLVPTLPAWLPSYLASYLTQLGCFQEVQLGHSLAKQRGVLSQLLNSFQVLSTGYRVGTQCSCYRLVSNICSIWFSCFSLIWLYSFLHIARNA